MSKATKKFAREVKRGVEKEVAEKREKEQEKQINAPQASSSSNIKLTPLELPEDPASLAKIEVVKEEVAENIWLGKDHSSTGYARYTTVNLGEGNFNRSVTTTISEESLLLGRLNYTDDYLPVLPSEASDSLRVIIDPSYRATMENRPITLEPFVLNKLVPDFLKVDDLVAQIKTEFTDLNLQHTLFNTILNKIKVWPYQNRDLDIFKSKVLLADAQVIINMTQGVAEEQIKFREAKTALSLLEQANKIQNPDLIKEIEQCTVDLIKNHKVLLEAFELAKTSVELREENFADDHPSILASYFTAASFAKITNEKSIKIQALGYAERAYNTAFYTDKLDKASEALILMADINRDLNDTHKADMLMWQSTSLTSKAVHGQASYEVVRKTGLSDDVTVAMKQKIQPTLDKVCRAAASGYWTHKVGGIEYGVSGWLDENCIRSILGSEFSSERAKMLIFEAINLGIMSTPDKNPLCAAIFVQENPELIKIILEKHPEYFVDIHIFKSTITITSIPVSDIENLSRDLFAQNLASNESGNRYLEDQIKPRIEERLKDTLDKITGLINKDEWNKDIEKELLNYAETSYLTTPGLVKNSILGNNLSIFHDGLNITRMLMFKAILTAVKESGSTNYKPIEKFTEEYPDVVARVLSTHPEYVTDQNFYPIIYKIIPEQVNHQISIASEKSDSDGCRDNIEVASDTSKQISALEATDIPVAGALVEEQIEYVT